MGGLCVTRYKKVKAFETYLEEDPAAQQLAEDAADGPDVDGVGVVLGTEQDLWGAIVLGHHLLGHRLAGVLLLHPETENIDI